MRPPSELHEPYSPLLRAQGSLLLMAAAVDVFKATGELPEWATVSLVTKAGDSPADSAPAR